MNGTHICLAHLGPGATSIYNSSPICTASPEKWRRRKSPRSTTRATSVKKKKEEREAHLSVCACKYGKWRMNQKFSQQRKPWFQLPGCLMSHSMLVNNIPYHSRTTIYSQNQDPPPTSLRQFHHPPGETPPKAERLARSGGGRNPFPSSTLFPPPPSLPSPLFSSLCISVHVLSHSSFSPFPRCFSCCRRRCVWRDGWKHKRGKE